MKKQSEHVHLLDADGNHCRWPMWQDDGRGWVHIGRLIVCGKPGYPWCPEHRAKVFSNRRLELVS